MRTVPCQNKERDCRTGEIPVQQSLFIGGYDFENNERQTEGDLTADQAKKEMIRATRKPTPPTSVSMMVQVLRVVFSSMPTRLFTSQKPESLKWEQTVEPPAMAAKISRAASGSFTYCYFCRAVYSM